MARALWKTPATACAAVSTNRSNDNAELAQSAITYRLLGEIMNRKQLLNYLLGLAVGASAMIGATTQAADTIKVGILHSLSGTMAISERL